jgi:hypothetical protein
VRQLIWALLGSRGCAEPCHGSARCSDRCWSLPAAATAAQIAAALVAPAVSARPAVAPLSAEARRPRGRVELPLRRAALLSRGVAGALRFHRAEPAPAEPGRAEQRAARRRAE